MTVAGLDGPGFEVEPAALRGAAGSFESEADTLDHVRIKLDQFLAGLGPCWGADEVGQRFATAYQPAADTVLANMAALASGLNRIASALRGVADNYERVDQSFSSQARTYF
jgi:uncharacterized protein YukE